MTPTLSYLQALEETKMNQVRIITELEKEKKKMQDDVQKLKDAKVKPHLNIAWFWYFAKNVFSKEAFLSLFFCDNFFILFFQQNREKVREEFRASFNSIGRKNSLAGKLAV